MEFYKHYFQNYVMYILYNTYMWGFETSILYSCGCFSFIIVNNLMVAIFAETFCWLYDEENKIVVFELDIRY